jgi:hypothetical protein
MADTPKRKKPDAPQGAQGRLPPKFEADTEPAEEEETEKDTVEVLDSDGTPAAKPKLPATHRSTISKRGDLLQAYLSEVRRHPLLDPEEEKELAIRYTETQDPEAAAQEIKLQSKGALWATKVGLVPGLVCEWTQSDSSIMASLRGIPSVFSLS